jgi:hypothetical protein
MNGQPTSATPAPRKPQFGMRGLLVFTTGLCVLFAVLAALRVAYWQMLVGFLITSLISLLVIVVLEALKHYDARRRGRRQNAAPFVDQYRYRAAFLPTAREREIAPLDPTGIEFVEPQGISFVEQQANDSASPPAPVLADFADESASRDPAKP